MKVLKMGDAAPQWRAVLLFSCVLFTGCTSVSEVQSSLRAIPPGKGILLVSVDTDIPIPALHLQDVHTGSDNVVLSDIPVGRTVRPVLIAAGDYEWYRVDGQGQLVVFEKPGYASYSGVQDEWFDLAADKRHLKFSVKAGVVNYPGEFFARSTASDQVTVAVPEWNQRGAYQVPGLGHYFDVVDRLSLDLAAADGSIHGLIAKYGLAYTGPGADTFPEYLQSLPANPARIAAAAGPVSDTDSLEDYFAADSFRHMLPNPSGRQLLAVYPRPGFGAELLLIDLATHSVSEVIESDEDGAPFRGLTWLDDDTAVYIGASAVSGNALNAIRWQRSPEGVLDLRLKRWEGNFWIASGPMHGGHVIIGSNYGTQDDPRACLLGAEVMPAPDVLKLGDCRTPLPARASGAWLDAQGQAQVAVQDDGDGTSHFFKSSPSTPAAPEWKEFLQVPAGQRFMPVQLGPDGRDLMVVAVPARGASSYSEYDLDSGKSSRTLFSEDTGRVADVHVDPRSREADVLTWYSGLEPHVELLDPQSSEQSRLLQAEFPGEDVVPNGSSLDGKRLFGYVFDSHHTGEYYVYDRETRQTTAMGSAQTDFAAPGAVTTKDGAKIGYRLSLPVTPARAYPLVVMASSTAESTIPESNSFDAATQFLASRGYAVLTVAYPGSWRPGGEARFAEVVHTILNDARVDKNRVCIFGIGFGGYAALMSAIRNPQLYSCVASLSGVTDIPLLYDTSNLALDQALRWKMTYELGIPDSDKESLRDASPVYLAKSIRCPVLIAQGQDGRLDMEQAQRMHTTLERLGRPVEYLSYEGGELKGEDAEIDYYKHLLSFLDRNIGPAAAAVGSSGKPDN